MFCSVDVSDLKAELMEALDALKEGVLTAMRQRLRQSSDKLIEQFQLTEVELNKASGTGEEVLALKKYIQRSQTQQEKMKEDILHNKRSIDFLVRHLMPVTQEVRFSVYIFCLDLVAQEHCVVPAAVRCYSPGRAIVACSYRTACHRFSSCRPDTAYTV